MNTTFLPEKMKRKRYYVFLTPEKTLTNDKVQLLSGKKIRKSCSFVKRRLHMNNIRPVSKTEFRPIAKAHVGNMRQ